MNLFSEKKDILRFNLLFLGFCIIYAVSCAFLSIIPNNCTNYIKAYKSESDIVLEEKSKVDCIIIDAGHGGMDIGGISASGIIEKDINLNISKYLQALLKLSDYNIVMTRSADNLLYKDGQENRKKYYDLVNRVAIADSYENCIFVSIHQNMFTSPNCHGFQVYYSKNNSESKFLAQILQKSAVKNLQPKNKRLSKPAGSEILVLHKISKIAVLVECGFLSNPTEAELLTTDAYQKKLAMTIYTGILNYLDER